MVPARARAVPSRPRERRLPTWKADLRQDAKSERPPLSRRPFHCHPNADSSAEPDPRGGGLADGICRARHLTMRHQTTSISVVDDPPDVGAPFFALRRIIFEFHAFRRRPPPWAASNGAPSQQSGRQGGVRVGLGGSRRPDLRLVASVPRGQQERASAGGAAGAASAPYPPAFRDRAHTM